MLFYILESVAIKPVSCDDMVLERTLTGDDVGDDDFDGLIAKLTG